MNCLADGLGTGTGHKWASHFFLLSCRDHGEACGFPHLPVKELINLPDLGVQS